MPLDGRVPGGLGLHLVQRMVDSLEYEYHDRQSTVRFTKESG
jgi:anti-sigma regulatory factor (Ser/Thr protein kinase)